MRVVVFGGSGFLGSHVADALSETGHDVVVFDIAKSLYARDNQEIVVGDILDESKVAATVKGAEAVYNFAGIADIDECINRPTETIKYNILGNAVILEAARNEQVKRFVFASSAYVYSKHGFFYQSSKRSAEMYIENFQQLFGLPFTILRYGSLYGERADMRNSVHRLLHQALATGRIEYAGTGDEVREYIHVEDAAKCSVDILAPQFENENVVLTGQQIMRYRDLLEMIKEMLGGKVEIAYKDSDRDAHYQITPYSFNPKMGKKLVANPFVDMGQGLLRCMQHIYEDIHDESHEELGLLVSEDDSTKTHA